MKNANGNLQQPLSWRTCQIIRKKAVEQKFSWSGIMVSLSLSLVIVVVCAQALNVFNQSLQSQKNNQASRPSNSLSFLN